MKEPIDVHVAVDDESGWKALYVDGLQCMCDESINISEMIAYIKGRPCILTIDWYRIRGLSENGFPYEKRDLEDYRAS